ncbi:MAG: QueT transporter family protein [Firmicutes bacterium]|nr:QueT transporter family protein [Bacillota bacterium]
MKQKKSVFITQAALIAAMYTALTVLIAAFNLASGAVQVRLSEALTVLPVFTPAAVPGLFIGCFLSNLITGCALWDVLFGSLATLLGALGTRLLRSRPLLAVLPPIVSNTLIVPVILAKVYGVPDSIWFLMLTVGIGEVISCGILGSILQKALKPYQKQIFKETE